MQQDKGKTGKLNNPFRHMEKREMLLWIFSMTVVVITNFFMGDFDLLTFIATSVGVTSLVFAAMGNIWSPILAAVFSILYAIISYKFRYWGELITYGGMTLPMAVWSTVTWFKNPSEDDGNVVQSRKLTANMGTLVILASLGVTALFYFILSALDTPNIWFSTFSVTTSFIAATFTMLRTSYYAVAYASNDIILIVLWTLASLQNPVYIPVVANFAIFFVNDIYGFICWKKREPVNES